MLYEDVHNGGAVSDDGIYYGLTAFSDRNDFGGNGIYGYVQL